MKRLNLMIWIFGVAILFSGCAKEDFSPPGLDPADKATPSLKAAKVHTHFTGTCNLIHFDPENAWYDLADDARVTGVTIWVTESMIPIDDITVELSGTAELFMGAETVGDDYDGKWEMSWKGAQTLTSPDGSTFRIVCHAKGTGTEGDVLGMTAKWKYTMDFDGTPETMHYVVKGKITKDR